MVIFVFALSIELLLYAFFVSKELKKNSSPKAVFPPSIFSWEVKIEIWEWFKLIFSLWHDYRKFSIFRLPFRILRTIMLPLLLQNHVYGSNWCRVYFLSPVIIWIYIYQMWTIWGSSTILQNLYTILNPFWSKFEESYFCFQIPPPPYRIWLF